MTRTLAVERSRRALPLALAVALGLALALATAGLSWRAGAVGLGFVMAVLAGLAQRCSA